MQAKHDLNHHDIQKIDGNMLNVICVFNSLWYDK